MKWMDGPSFTEMDREGVYEMEGRTKCQKNGYATKMENNHKTFWIGSRICYYILSISVAFPFFCTLSVY